MSKDDDRKIRENQDPRYRNGKKNGLDRQEAINNVTAFTPHKRGRKRGRRGHSFEATRTGDRQGEKG